MLETKVLSFLYPYNERHLAGDRPYAQSVPQAYAQRVPEGLRAMRYAQSHPLSLNSSNIMKVKKVGAFCVDLNCRWN